MSVILMQVFVSLMLVAAAVVLFVFSIKQRDFEHADRLALCPLEEDGQGAATNKHGTGATSLVAPDAENAASAGATLPPQAGTVTGRSHAS